MEVKVNRELCNYLISEVRSMHAKFSDIHQMTRSLVAPPSQVHLASQATQTPETMEKTTQTMEKTTQTTETTATKQQGTQTLQDTQEMQQTTDGVAPLVFEMEMDYTNSNTPISVDVFGKIYPFWKTPFTSGGDVESSSDDVLLSFPSASNLHSDDLEQFAWGGNGRFFFTL